MTSECNCKPRSGLPFTLITLVLFLLCCTSLPAQSGAQAISNSALFRRPTVYDSAGQLAWALAVADVNGDGKPDIVEVNYTGTTFEGVVGVLLNQGKGSFRPAVTYDSGGIEGISVAIADLNHDGKPDIIVANGSDGVTGRIQIGVLMGNGDGTFQNAVKYDAGGAALGIGGLSTIPFTVTDVNGDGKPDLVVDNQGTDYNGGDGLVGVLLGNGDGTFKPVLAYDTGASWLTSIALADFNKDGKLDVVGTNCYATDGFFCSAPQSTVSVGLGDGDGTFRHIATLDKGGAGDGGSPVVVADLNHDGNPDLIVGNSCPNNSGPCMDHATVGILLGRGDGTFQNVVTYDSKGPSVASILAVDVNRDGTLDLVVQSGGPAVLLGNGDGTFHPAQKYSGPGMSQVAVDVNGDGQLDLVSGGDTSANVGVLLGHGDGTFDAPLIYPAGGNLITVFAIADVSGDGKPDILTASWGWPGHPQRSVIGALLHADFVTKTVLASSNLASWFGQPTTFTATMTSTKGTIPDGELVTFTDGKTTLGTAALAGGAATFTMSTLSATKHHIRATYSGDNWFASGSGALTQVVNKDPSATLLTSSPNPAELGQGVTLTAHVTKSYGSNAVTGKVRFFNGIVAMGSATIQNGVASLTTSSLRVGAHAMTAAYLGDATSDISSAAPLIQLVK